MKVSLNTIMNIPASDPDSSSLPSTTNGRPWWRKILQKLAGTHPDMDEHIRDLVENRDEPEEPLSSDEKQIIRAALRFSKITAEYLSIPRSDIVAVREDSSFDDIASVFTTSGHSRLPVIREDVDDIIGFINIKDLIRHIVDKKKFDLKKALHPCTFVPETLNVSKVLEEMRKQRVQMAIVVDEYGGTAGLITLTDIIEHLVGDLEDEHDRDEPLMMIPLPNGRYRIDPRMDIEELEERLGTHLTTTDSVEAAELTPEMRDFETIGGLLLSIAHRVPETGETFPLSGGYTLKVIESDSRRLKSLELQLPHSRKADKDNRDE